MNMETINFNQIPIGTVFHHPEKEDWIFVKFANADLKRPPHKQAPNCFGLFNKHYFSCHARTPVVVLKEPDDYDDSKLNIC